MTPQEALKVLSDTHFSVNNEAEEQKCRVYQAAFKTAIQALEKQIPKKPLQACGHATNKTMNYCPVCGQALDWSDTE